MVTADVIRDVEDLHWKYGSRGLRRLVELMTPETRREFYQFRLRFIREEYDELVTAKTPEDAVDAWIDLVVIAVGTLDAFGVDVRKAWSEVQRANVAKTVGVNPSRPNPFGLPDLVKPDGWTAPTHQGNRGMIPDQCKMKGGES